MTPPPPVADATPIEQADAAAVEVAADARRTLPVRVAGALSELADQPPLFTFAGVVLAGGLLAGEARLAKAGARMIAAAGLATLAKTAVKRRVDRTRPYRLVDDNEYRMEPGETPTHALNSFPSGHTAGAVAAARAYARAFPGHAVPAAAAAALVAIVQIPRCRHYPSDVAAGALIGLAAEALVDAAIRAAVDRAP
ncbi:MAG: phosphatase PAP2 family protein [Sphingomonas fennica]